MPQSWFTAPATTSGKILKSSYMHPCWWDGASEKSRRKGFLATNMLAVCLCWYAWQNKKLLVQVAELEQNTEGSK